MLKKKCNDNFILEPIDELTPEELEDHKMLMSDEAVIYDDPETINYYGEIFRNAAKQRKAISLRVPTNDYFALRAKAKKLGLPYQALINSIIHRFVSEDLDESYFNRQIKKVG
jgi:predicted DNA binding CopG/RHH family protein